MMNWSSGQKQNIFPDLYCLDTYQEAIQQLDANLLSARQWPSMSFMNNDPVFRAAMHKINFPPSMSELT